MASTEILFDKNVQMRIQNQHPSEDSLSRLASIRIVVKSNIYTTPNHKRDLIVRLTDDNNWYFLYTLVLSEEDFGLLRGQQGLLVDFNTFPSSLIALIRQCENDTRLEQQHHNQLHNEGANHGHGHSNNCTPNKLLDSLSHLSVTNQNNNNSSSYTLNLIQSELPGQPAQLNISEINAFRQITHLNLKLIQGDDTDIKEYLAECLAMYKDSYEKTSSELNNTRSSLNSRLEKAEAEINRIELIKNDLERELRNKTETLTIQHQNELHNLREEKSLKEAKYLDSNRKDREEFENLMKNEREMAHQKIGEQEGKIEELTARKFRLESSLREHKVKISGFEEEMKASGMELKKLRMFNHDLNLQRHESEKIISQLKTQVALLEQEVKMKIEIIDKTSQQKEDINSQKKFNDERVEEYKFQNKKLSEKLQSLGEEMIKANEIIKKQHNNIKELSFKNQTKNHMVLQQEKVIKEKTEKLSSIKSDFQEVSILTSEKEEKIAKYETEINEMREKLKNNENCIQWLNKQLNEKQMGGAALAADPSYMASRLMSSHGGGHVSNIQVGAPIPSPSLGALTGNLTNRSSGNHPTSILPIPSSNNLGGMRRSLDTMTSTQTGLGGISENQKSKTPQYSSTPVVRNPNLLKKSGMSKEGF